MKTRFMIGAPQSGGGKTTFTMGVMRALQRRGYVVRPFKCGPDNVDTIFHRWACGNESVNLDRWLQSEKNLKESFAYYSKNSDVSVVEGIMGLYDGYDRMRGSSAEISVTLRMPVVLVVNARATTYSIAPLLYGYRHFNADVRLAGVVFNQVDCPGQLPLLRKACEDIGVDCFGYIPHMDGIEIPSHHLGLTLEPTAEVDRLIDKLADAVEQTVDLDQLLKDTSLDDEKFEITYPVHKKHQKEVGKQKIAVAYDEAFNFIFEENIKRLKELGDVVMFSPLHDENLPEADLVYLPSGYPEFYLKGLSDNKPMRQAIKAYAENGGRIWAECGGLIYLGRCMVGMDDVVYQLAGVLPFDSTMKNAHPCFGYRKMKMGREEWYGHETHYSHIMDDSDLEKIGEQINARGQKVDTVVYKWKNVRAGFTRWYWAERDLNDWWKE